MVYVPPKLLPGQVCACLRMFSVAKDVHIAKLRQKAFVGVVDNMRFLPFPAIPCQRW